jgi:FlaA1/EpsC-like NDP-sugar epimerase
MTDLASDHDAAIRLVIEEHKKLQGYYPGHPLLKYCKIIEDGIEWNNKYYEEFLDRFETEEDKKHNHIKVAKVTASYFVALNKIIQQIEDPNGNKKPKEENPRKTIESSVNRDLPF